LRRQEPPLWTSQREILHFFASFAFSLRTSRSKPFLWGKIKKFNRKAREEKPQRRKDIQIPLLPLTTVPLLNS